MLLATFRRHFIFALMGAVLLTLALPISTFATTSTRAGSRAMSIAKENSDTYAGYYLDLSNTTVSPSNPTGGGNTPPYTFTGTGGGDTPPFQVGTNWSLDISCTSSTPMRPGNFLIYVVDNSDGKIISGPIDVESCTGLGVYGEQVPEAQGGTFSLQVNAKADISWEIQIRMCANQPTC